MRRMTTPIVIETVRDGNAVGKPNRNGQATATPPGDHVW